MSGFGLIVILLFILVTGGLVALMYGGNSDLTISKFLMLLLHLLICAEFILALYEYPAYLADGILFACMGEQWLAYVMFGIVGAIVLFALFMILPRIKWSKSLSATPAKLIFSGLLLVCLLAYTELLNGVYSFESYDQFKQVKARYEQYDDRFFPTKYILHYTDEQERVALYPFDVTTAAGSLPVIYKGETYLQINEDGSEELFFFPFTYKLYEGSEPVSFNDATYGMTDEEKKALASASDVSASDVSASDTASGSDTASQ